MHYAGPPVTRCMADRKGLDGYRHWRCLWWRPCGPCSPINHNPSWLPSKLAALLSPPKPLTDALFLPPKPLTGRIVPATKTTHRTHCSCHQNHSQDALFLPPKPLTGRIVPATKTTHRTHCSCHQNHSQDDGEGLVKGRLGCGVACAVPAVGWVGCAGDKAGRLTAIHVHCTTQMVGGGEGLFRGLWAQQGRKGSGSFADVL